MVNPLEGDIKRPAAAGSEFCPRSGLIGAQKKPDVRKYRHRLGEPARSISGRDLDFSRWGKLRNDTGRRFRSHCHIILDGPRQQLEHPVSPSLPLGSYLQPVSHRPYFPYPPILWQILTKPL